MSLEIPLEIVVQHIFGFVYELDGPRASCRSGAAAAEDIARLRLDPLGLRLAEATGSYAVLWKRLSVAGTRGIACTSREMWLRLTEDERVDRVERLRRAVRENDGAAIGQLVAMGVDLDFRLATYLPAVHAAAFDGRDDALEALLVCGASVRVTADGHLPLGLASVYGRLNSLRLILRYHPDSVNMKNFNGFTALIAAVAVGEFDACQELINHGADISCTTRNGLDALTLANRRNRTAISRLLTTHMKTPDEKNISHNDISSNDHPPQQGG